MSSETRKHLKSLVDNPNINNEEVHTFYNSWARKVKNWFIDMRGCEN